MLPKHVHAAIENFMCYTERGRREAVLSAVNFTDIPMPFPNETREAALEEYDDDNPPDADFEQDFIAVYKSLTKYHLQDVIEWVDEVFDYPE